MNRRQAFAALLGLPAAICLPPSSRADSAPAFLSRGEEILTPEQAQSLIDQVRAFQNRELLIRIQMNTDGFRTHLRDALGID